WGLIIQGIWAGVLVLPRTVKTDAVGNVAGYGNLYGNLLDYVISAALIFYILTILGLFLLRWKRPDAERPYKAFGYPIVPALYIVGAAVILLVLFVYQTATTWPGLIIVLTGVPIYFLWKFFGTKSETTHGKAIRKKAAGSAHEGGRGSRRTQPETLARGDKPGGAWHRGHYWRGFVYSHCGGNC